MSEDKTLSAEFPHQSRFLNVAGSRMHYVEVGEGAPILFLHGNPTSSYLWRNIIPHLTVLGRCVAVDLIGMGRSDKPDIDYRFVDHSRYVEGFIEEMGLEDIAFVIHDWGSALGFHYASRNPANVRGLAFMEAILMPFPPLDPDTEFGKLFTAFRTQEVGWDMIVNQNFFVEKVLPGSIVRDLTEEEMDRYRGPFTDPDSRRPLWRWPNEIPIAGQPEDVTAIVQSYNGWLQETDIPKILFYAHPGAIIQEPLVTWCREHLKNLETVDIGPGIHFLQEDNPHLIGKELARWLTTTAAVRS